MKSIKSIIATVILILFVTGSLQDNFDFENAEAIQTLPTTIALDNTGSSNTATLEGYCEKLDFATSFLWYKIEPTQNLRIFSFSTCTSEIDTILAVFTGVDPLAMNDLSIAGCNDDIFYGGPSCSGGSVLENIPLNAGETLYIVIGGSTISTGKTQGSGTLEITLIDPSDAGCSSELILQVKQDIQTALTAASSDIDDVLSLSEDNLQTSISTSQTAITNAITASETSLSTSINGIQDAIDVIDTLLDTTDAAVTSISTLLGTVNTNVGTLQSELTNVGAAVDVLSGDLSLLSTSVTSKFTTSNTNIDSLQTTATSISTSSTDLLSSLNGIKTANVNLLSDLTSFHSAVTTSFVGLNADVTSINTELTNTATAIDTINTNIGSVDTSLTTLSTSLSTFTTSMENSFTTSNANVDQLDAVSTQVKASVDQILLDGAAIQLQQSNMALQLTNFEDSVDDKFTELDTDVVNVNTDITSLQTSAQSSFTARTLQLNALEVSSDNTRTNTEQALNTLSTLSSGISENTHDAVFIDTLIRYLPDRSNTNPPLSLRMPNAYGGHLNDAADWVSLQYSELKAAALLIGAKGTSECNADPFCKFFLGTADAAYTDSISKFTLNLNARKLRTAYSYLQQAFINLYPSTW